jgi:hypothetical protein
MAAQKSNKAIVPMWRKLMFLVIITLCGVFIAHGAKVFDIEEVLANATILCLSCIGIG